MIKDKNYSYVWPDGGIVKFIVTAIDRRMIYIRFANGVDSKFSVGSPMYMHSKPVRS